MFGEFIYKCVHVFRRKIIYLVNSSVIRRYLHQKYSLLLDDSKKLGMFKPESQLFCASGFTNSTCDRRALLYL